MAPVLRVIPIVVAFLITVSAVQAADWRAFVDPDSGASALYPAHIFSATAPNPDVPGQAFVSADRAAKLAIGSWLNAENQTPSEFRDKLLADSRYASLTYRPRGRSWFVLSGFRGDKVYYEKVVYTCGRRVVNAFAIMYPVAQRAVYDPIVERMEDHFRAGRRCG